MLNLCNVVFCDAIRQSAHVNDEPSGRRSAELAVTTAESASIAAESASIAAVKSFVSAASEA